MDNVSKLFGWLNRLPSIRDAKEEALEGAKKTRVIIRRYQEADENLKTLIKENGFSHILLYNKGE